MTSATSPYKPPTPECPYTTLGEGPEGVYTTIRLCPDEVQKIKKDINEAYKVAHEVYTIRLGNAVLSASKGAVTLDPKDLGQQALEFLYNLKNADGSTLSRIGNAIGASALSALEDAATGIGVDDGAGGFFLWLAVSGGTLSPEPDGHLVVSITWLWTTTTVVLTKTAEGLAKIAVAGFLTLVRGSDKSTGNLSILREPGSKLYLHVYDMQGRHVGVNPDGTVATEIPGAYYYDAGSIVVILLPLSLADFRLNVDARDAQEPTEQYSIGVLSLTENSASVYAASSEIDKGTQAGRQVAISSSQVMIDRPEWEVFLVRLFWMDTDSLMIALSAVVTTLVALVSSALILRRIGNKRKAHLLSRGRLHEDRLLRRGQSHDIAGGDTLVKRGKRDDRTGGS